LAPEPDTGSHAPETATADDRADLLEAACQGLPLDVVDLLAALDPDERTDAKAGRIEGTILKAFAVALVDRRDRGRGVVPASYIHRATCEHCGPVWYWHGGRIASCIWCENRLRGLPIPRPEAVVCGDCEHFVRTPHRRIGHCAAGQPEAIAGLWDACRRTCGRWLPAEHGHGGTP